MSKTAVITGATSGIGASYAKRLASQGYDLFLTGRRQEIIQKLADDLTKQFNIKANVILAELSDDNDIQRVVDAIKSVGNLEILVNNAGYLDSAAFFDEKDLAAHERMMKVFMTVPVRLIYAALPNMTKNRRGIIINISSRAAFLPSKKFPIYAASKAFLKSFSESLYLGVRHRGIKVQVVCPEFIDTDIFRSHSAEQRKAIWGKCKFKSAESVVECSMKDLEKNRVVCIPGIHNQVIYALLTILPRSYVYKRACHRVY